MLMDSYACRGHIVEVSMNVFLQEQLLVVLNLRAFPVVSLQIGCPCLQCISWSVLRVHTVHVSGLATATDPSEIELFYP